MTLRSCMAWCGSSSGALSTQSLWVLATKARRAPGGGPRGGPAPAPRNSTKVSSRSTSRAGGSSEVGGIPRRTAARRRPSASGQAPQRRPSLGRAWKTEKSSCSLNCRSRRRQLGSSACTAESTCGATPLSSSRCRLKAQRRLARPCAWTCCWSAGSSRRRRARPAKRGSWRTPIREKDQAVMESSCGLNSGRSRSASWPISWHMETFRCTFAVARPHTRLASSTELTRSAAACLTNLSATRRSTLDWYCCAVTIDQAMMVRFEREKSARLLPM
mmetsp:Transcript_83482/g.236860  ORF Transcript_83482/g.236860 Transcript_83482/m.236860 type:complete len:274 (+) Transcript_83482:118-939(+)